MMVTGESYHAIFTLQVTLLKVIAHAEIIHLSPFPYLILLQAPWGGQRCHQEVRHLLLERGGPEVQVATGPQREDLHSGDHHIAGECTLLFFGFVLFVVKQKLRFALSSCARVELFCPYS